MPHSAHGPLAGLPKRAHSGYMSGRGATDRCRRADTVCEGEEIQALAPGSVGYNGRRPAWRTLEA